MTSTVLKIRGKGFVHIGCSVVVLMASYISIMKFFIDPSILYHVILKWNSAP